MILFVSWGCGDPGLGWNRSLIESTCFHSVHGRLYFKFCPGMDMAFVQESHLRDSDVVVLKRSLSLSIIERL